MVEKDNMCIYWAGFFGHELDIQKRARKRSVIRTVRVSHHLLLTAREKGKEKGKLSRIKINVPNTSSYFPIFERV